MRDFVRRYKWYLVGALAGIAVLASLSRRPPEKVVEKVQVQEATVAKATKVAAKKTRSRRVTVTDRKPDGSSRSVTTVDQASDLDLRLDLDTSSLRTVSSERSVESSRPSWAVRVDAGWNPRELQLKPSELTIGADRRVLGGLWAGAWARQELSGKPVTAAGLGLRLEF